jgi:hypothetical protein
MEIFINGENVTNIAGKTELLEELHKQMVDAISKIPIAFQNDDGVVKYSNSEKDLSSL